MDSCTFEEILTTFVVYSTASTEFNTRIDGRGQVVSADSSIKSVELVAQGVVKLLTTKRIRFTIDLKPIQWSQDVPPSTHPSPVHAFSPSKRNLYGTP